MSNLRAHTVSTSLNQCVQRCLWQTLGAVPDVHQSSHSADSSHRCRLHSIGSHIRHRVLRAQNLADIARSHRGRPRISEGVPGRFRPAADVAPPRPRVLPSHPSTAQEMDLSPVTFLCNRQDGQLQSVKKKKPQSSKFQPACQPTSYISVHQDDELTYQHLEKGCVHRTQYGQPIIHSSHWLCYRHPNSTHTLLRYGHHNSKIPPQTLPPYGLIQTHLKTKLLTSFQFVNYNPTDANFTNPCGPASSWEVTWFNYVNSALAAAIYIHWCNDVMTRDVISFRGRRSSHTCNPALYWWWKRYHGFANKQYKT